jgi:hypothetical protein
MRQATILIMVLAAAVGCVADDYDNTDLAAAREEAESMAAPTHDPTGPNCPGGSGGPGDGRKPIPAPRDCTKEPDLEACLTCCDWNVDKSWGETCRRMPGRTKKQRTEKALCWERAERLRGECQAACPRGPIVTTGAP